MFSDINKSMFLSGVIVELPIWTATPMERFFLFIVFAIAIAAGYYVS